MTEFGREGVMWWMRLKAASWLVVGVGLAVVGVVVARLWWFEFGAALVLLAAGALGYVLGLGRSAALDAELTRQIDGRLDALREEQRRAIEAQWRADGVSPIERTWQELSQASASDGDSAAASPPSEAVDRTDARIEAPTTPRWSPRSTCTSTSPASMTIASCC